MVLNYGGEGFSECPVCKEDSFRYDNVIDANLCHNELCRWDDRPALPAIDVPISFLERCYNSAENPIIKDHISKVIDLTKKVNEDIRASY